MVADFRSEFPVTRQYAFLNHAAVAPLSQRAHDRVVEWLTDYTQHGNIREAEWYRRIEDVRRQAADVINADPAEVAFLKNTSEGLSLVAEGLALSHGDSVVIIAGEFPANIYPWLHLQSRGVEVRQVQSVERGRIRIEDLDAAIDSSTRLLSISHVQFATGFRSDLAAIGRLCRDRGVLFCVDAIQGLGVLPIDVNAMQIDFLSADGHKWLLSPEGAAIFYCRQENLDRLRPTSIGWKSVVNYGAFSTIDFRMPDTAARFECGSMNVPGIMGLGGSLELLAEVGLETVTRRVKTITDHLAARLTDACAAVYSLRGEDEWSGIVSFDWPHGDPKRIKQHCLTQNVVISFRDGRLRASPHFYNDEQDVARLMEALASSE